MNAKLNAKNVSRLSSFVRVYVSSIGLGHQCMQGETDADACGLIK